MRSMERVDGVRLEEVSEFKYLEYVLDKSSTDVAVSREVVSGRKFAGAIKSLINARGLHEVLLVCVCFMAVRQG